MYSVSLSVACVKFFCYNVLCTVGYFMRKNYIKRNYNYDSGIVHKWDSTQSTYSFGVQLSFIV